MNVYINILNSNLWTISTWKSSYHNFISSGLLSSITYLYQVCTPAEKEMPSIIAYNRDFFFDTMNRIL